MLQTLSAECYKPSQLSVTNPLSCVLLTLSAECYKPSQLSVTNPLSWVLQTLSAECYKPSQLSVTNPLSWVLQTLSAECYKPSQQSVTNPLSGRNRRLKRPCIETLTFWEDWCCCWPPECYLFSSCWLHGFWWRTCHVAMTPDWKREQTYNQPLQTLSLRGSLLVCINPSKLYCQKTRNRAPVGTSM